MQGNVLRINPKSANYILNIKGASLFEGPGDSLDFTSYTKGLKYIVP